MASKNKQKNITIDDLALMVAKGFIDVNEKMDSMNSEMKKMKTELKSEISDVKKELKGEFHKKVDIFTYKELEFRVERLEKVHI